MGDEDSTQEDDRHADFKQACSLAHRTDITVLSRFWDRNILAYLHVRLVFMSCMARYPEALAQLESPFPWDLVVSILNNLVSSKVAEFQLNVEEFPRFSGTEQRPLPEDFAMRGLLWSDDHFPDDWFTHEKIDLDIITSGFNWVTDSQYREHRILHVGYLLSQAFTPLSYDPNTGLFGVFPSEGNMSDLIILSQDVEPDMKLGFDNSCYTLGPEIPEEFAAIPCQGHSCQPMVTLTHGTLDDGPFLQSNMSVEKQTDCLTGPVTGPEFLQWNPPARLNTSDDAIISQDMLSLNVQRTHSLLFSGSGLSAWPSLTPVGPPHLIPDAVVSSFSRQRYFTYI